MRHHVIIVCRGVENMYHFECPLSFSEYWKPQIYANFYITHLQLEKSCPARTPDFIVTATRTFSVYNGTITLQVVTNTVNDSGGVSTFTVYTNLSSTDNSCLILQISAGNSAGISAPTEVAFRESDSIYTQTLHVLGFSHIIMHKCMDDEWTSSLVPPIAVCQPTDNVPTNSTKPTGHGNNNETSINGSSNNQRVERVNVLTGKTLPALSS